jgi:predicted ArsR family transcriptional regulator
LNNCGTTGVHGRRTEVPILTVDQLPDSRRAILIVLKQNGPSTIAQLADELRLTGEAVRQQLLQLQRDGWIEASIPRPESERGRTGRPAMSYSLTESGDHLFPKEYDALNVAVLDAVAEELGPDAALRILRRLSDAKVAKTAPSLRGRPLPERVEALKSLYAADDPYMETSEVEDGYLLIEKNCPFYNTAMHRPSLCSVSVNALTKLLGVRVKREQRFQNGDGRCVFHVYRDEPIDADAWEFRLED